MHCCMEKYASWFLYMVPFFIGENSFLVTHVYSIPSSRISCTLFREKGWVPLIFLDVNFAIRINDQLSCRYQETSKYICTLFREGGWLHNPHIPTQYYICHHIAQWFISRLYSCHCISNISRYILSSTHLVNNPILQRDNTTPCKFLC